MRCIRCIFCCCYSSARCSPNPLWERACSRIRWVSQYMCKLTHRLREQARSHICSALFVPCRKRTFAWRA
ncbi:hypothetical protein FFI16_029285 [Pseudomonas sp. KBS0710]|nr:hypothetical protein FFI16_029285 [Pseudomonas sp. KBS0710]